MWVCVFGYKFWHHPAFPGWGVELCVFVCALACTPPILAGVCGACVRVRVLASRVNPGWGLRCVCLGLGFAFTKPVLAGVLGCGFLSARSACAPLIPGWGLWCVCLGSGFAFTPRILAGVLGSVCLCALPACTTPFLAGVCGVVVCGCIRVRCASGQSSLRFWGVCVFVRALCLYPANPGWAVWCMCSGTGFSLSPPCLAGVCGVCVLVRFPFHPANPGQGVRRCRFVLRSACNLPFLAGVFGACVGVRDWLSPRHCWLKCGVCVLGCRLCPWSVSRALRCSFCLLFCGTGRPWLPGTWSCAVAVAGSVPLCCASWPRVGGPRLVRSGFSRCAARLPRRRGAFPYLRLTPLDLLGGCAGHVEAIQEPGSWCPPLAGAATGALGLLRVTPLRSPTVGLSLACPSGVSLGLRVVQCFGMCGPRHSRALFRQGPRGCFGWSLTSPLSSRRTHARVPCACACPCSSWPRQAGWLLGRVVVGLTFTYGCPSAHFVFFTPSGL